jgi:nuclear pore complex protein Nup54
MKNINKIIGIDPVLWEYAKKNNPNSKKLLPVSIIGFKDIHKRFNMQKKENEGQKMMLDITSERIESLNTRNKLLKAKIDQYKMRNDDLEQRILKVEWLFFWHT